jgi:hypothetical protein
MTYTDKLNLISAELVKIGKSVTGIVSAIDPPPANPDSAKLPLLYVFSGSAQNDEARLGENFVETKRVFRVQVAILPTGQGDPNTREIKCRPILDAVVLKYQAYFTLADLDFVERIKVLSDSGIVVLPEFGYKFIGFEVPVEVTYFVPRNFAADA